MPAFVFAPPPQSYLQTLGEARPEPHPVAQIATLNADTRNDYELVRDGVTVLNATLLPASGGQPRTAGMFERQTIGIYTDAGFKPIEVVTYDAGYRHREIVITRETTREIVQQAGQAETVQVASELSQAFSQQRTVEENAPYVNDPTSQPFYYQGSVGSVKTAATPTPAQPALPPLSRDEIYGYLDPYYLPQQGYVAPVDSWAIYGGYF